MSENIPQDKSKSQKEILHAALRTVKWSYDANRMSFILIFLLISMVSILPFVSSYIDSLVIDEIVGLLALDVSDRDTNNLFLYIAGSVVLSIIVSTMWVGVTYFEKEQHFNLARYFSIKFLEKSSTLDMYHYEDPESNNIIQKAKDIYEWRPRQFVNRLTWMVADLFRIITTVGIILSFSFPAFLLVVATTIPSLVVNLKLGKGSWGIWDANATTRRRYWWSKDLLARESSLMEIRIFRTREYLMKVIIDIYDSFTNKEKKDQLKRSIWESVFGNLSVVGTMVFWIIAIMATLQGEITVGLLTFYAGATNRFSDALNNFFRSLSRQYEEALYLVDYFKFMDLENTIEYGDISLVKTSEPPLIEFRNVSFAYPGTEKLVLKGLNLKINPSERIAFVGVNGAGKTTIIKLLCRFYDVTDGEILIDGKNIKDLDLDTWYKTIGVLFQSFIRYGQFSVSENVQLGDVDRIGDKDSLDQAIFKADAKDFINEYKNKLEQILDKSFEEGIDPSGGQWQRIALARAFFRDAPVLILDEPTSAIDAKAEYEIFERLYEFSENKTVIIISHRFSTVRQAGRIYVIDDGRVVESGTHNELMEINGKYAEAFEVQAQGYK